MKMEPSASLRDCTEIKLELDITKKPQNTNTHISQILTKCGEIFVSDDGEFQFDCGFCKNKFQKSETFCEHILGHHIADSDTKIFDTIKPIAGGASSFDEVGELNRHNDKVEGNTDKRLEMTEDPFRLQSTTRRISKRNKFKLLLDEEENLECPHCNEHYENKICLQEHIDNTHSAVEDNINPKIILNDDSTSLNSSHQSNNLNDKTFACTFENCDRTYATEQLLSAHSLLHSTKKPYECTICCIKFNRKSEMHYHVRVQHLNDQIFSCDECDKQFLNMYSLERHKICSHIDNVQIPLAHNLTDMATDSSLNEVGSLKKENASAQSTKAHSAANAIPDNLPDTDDSTKRATSSTNECNFCPLKFIYNSNLKEHIRRKHSELNVNADKQHNLSDSELNDDTTNNATRKRKLVGITERSAPRTPQDNTLICDICGKETLKYRMLQHLKSHDNSRYTFKCETCTKLFVSEKSLDIHVRNYHLKDRPFSCTYGKCNKTFATEYALTSHHTLHTSERPFKCPTCQKGFVCKSKLDHHIKTIHVNGRIFKCDECGKHFYEMKTLQVHQICHSTEKPFACDQCPARFPRERSLLWHKQSHTGIKPYVCKICGKGYALYNGIYSHMKTHGVKYSLALEKGDVDINDVIKETGTESTGSSD